MLDLNTTLSKVVSIFDSLEIPYFIGGSVASSLLGIFRHTNDIDLVGAFTGNEADAFHQAVKSDFYIDYETFLEAIKTETSFSILHLETMIKVDVFIKKRDAWSNQAFSRRKKTAFGDDLNPIEIYLPSVEDMILQKLIWFELSGGKSERQWNDVKNMIKLKANQINYLYLFQWGGFLKLMNQLDQVILEVESELKP